MGPGNLFLSKIRFTFNFQASARRKWKFLAMEPKMFPLMKYAQLLENTTSSKSISEPIYVNEVVNNVFTGLSSFAFLLITIPLIIKRSQGIIDTTLGVGLLFFTGLVTVVAELCLTGKL